MPYRTDRYSVPEDQIPNSILGVARALLAVANGLHDVAAAVRECTTEDDGRTT